MATLGAFCVFLKAVASALSVVLSVWKLYRMWKRKRDKRKPTA